MFTAVLSLAAFLRNVTRLTRDCCIQLTTYGIAKTLYIRDILAFMADCFASQIGLARVRNLSSNASRDRTAGEENTSTELLRLGSVQLLVLLIIICWLTGCV